MNKDSNIHDEYYLAYCMKGCCKYTEENPPKKKNLENDMWDKLSEIRKVFSKKCCKRMKNLL